MTRIVQTRDPDLSLWQSAVDETVARHAHARTRGAGAAEAAVRRPDSDNDPMIAAMNALVVAADASHHAPGSTPSAPATRGLGDAAKYCASLGYQLAKALLRGDRAAAKKFRAELGPFTSCDPRFVEAAEKYVEYFKLHRQQVPYRKWKSLDDFVIDGRLPNRARVAIVGDWGTGQPEARQVLTQIRALNPDVVIHVGDIYYSGTEFEVEHYFLAIWKEILGDPMPPSFSLAGNHDLYSGGRGYYGLLDKLGQPASYFCLRNDKWQFLALDTGLHDDDPLTNNPTFLEDSEVKWAQHQVDGANGRKTILLSHHQFFSAYESFAKSPVNERLRTQLGPMLPKLSAWFWGHEHNLVIYKQYAGVLGRCVGHGAYPVGLNEIPKDPMHPEIGRENIAPRQGAAFYDYGFVTIDLDGASAEVKYWGASDTTKPMWSETL